MKKLLSILSALVILISGMHITMSAHICGGQVSAVKWSFGGDRASCNMHESNLPDGTTIIDVDCCHNADMTVATDKNYSPSVKIQLPELTSSSFSFNYLLPMIPSIVNIKESLTSYIIFSEKDISGSMPLAELCIFRI